MKMGRGINRLSKVFTVILLMTFLLTAAGAVALGHVSTEKPLFGAVLIGMPEGGIIGANTDAAYNVRTQVIVEQPRDGQKFVASQLTFPDGKSPVIVAGVNQAGVAFAWADVPIRDPQVAEMHIGPEDIGKFILTYSLSVSDVFNLLDSAPRGFAGEVLVSDSSKDVLLLEVTPKHLAIARYIDGEDNQPQEWVAAVNAFITPDLASQQSLGSGVATDALGNNYWRYIQAGLLLEESARSSAPEDPIQKMARILSDQGNSDINPLANPVISGWGFSIENHGSNLVGFDSNNPAWGTVSSQIIDPANRTLWYCFGWPSGAKPQYPDQIKQDKSWGLYRSFSVDDLAEGVYTTLEGELTSQGQANSKAQILVPPQANKESLVAKVLQYNLGLSPEALFAGMKFHPGEQPKAIPPKFKATQVVAKPEIKPSRPSQPTKPKPEARPQPKPKPKPTPTNPKPSQAEAPESPPPTVAEPTPLPPAQDRAPVADKPSTPMSPPNQGDNQHPDDRGKSNITPGKVVSSPLKAVGGLVSGVGSGVTSVGKLVEGGEKTGVPKTGAVGKVIGFPFRLVGGLVSGIGELVSDLGQGVGDLIDGTGNS